MSRKADETRLRAAQFAIEKQPGQKAGFYARLLGWHRESVNRILTMLNEQGILLSEDDKGGLWPFGEGED